jgi:hypothetical protein
MVLSSLPKPLCAPLAELATIKSKFFSVYYMSEENSEDFKPKAKDALLRILRQKVSLKKKRYNKSYKQR